METVISVTISTVTSTILGLIIGVLSTRIRNYKKTKTHQDEDMALIKDAQRHLLRQSLKDDHEYFTCLGYCPVADKEEVEKTYETYHGLGGNGMGTNLRNNIMVLPDKPIENK